MANFLVSYIKSEVAQTIEANTFSAKDGFIYFYNYNNVVIAVVNQSYVLSVQKVSNG